MAGLMFPKPRAAALERADRRKARQTVDERESDKVKARSGGQCEVRFQVGAFAVAHCGRRAFHVHHMLGGIGVRAIGRSALAAHKQHVCSRCHSAIGAHILQRVGGDPPMWTDTYRKLT